MGRDDQPYSPTTEHPMPQMPTAAHALLLSLPIAACVVDSQGCIVALNPEGENLLGWGAASCIGKPLHDLLDCTFSDDHGAPSCPLSHVLCSDLPVQIPHLLVRTRSGALRPVEYRCASLADPLGPHAIVTWRDVSQQLHLEDDLHRLASIPEESPDPIVEFDQSATLLYANPAMMELIGQFGFDTDAFPAILPPRMSDIIQACLCTGVTRSGLMVTRAGSSYEWRFSPVPHTALVRGYGVNLTERMRIEEELRQAKETAEAASKVKSAFLATVSHELRTPMNGILGMLDLLCMTPLTAEQQEYAEIAKRSTTDLLHLVNDLLDFSKIEAGKLKLEHRDFHLPDLVKRTLVMFAPQAGAKKLHLRCELAPELPAIVRGDPVHLQQVLINLVGNAVKFTERGEVVLQVQCSKFQVPSQHLSSPTLNLEPETLNQVVLRFSVQDTGSGIPENQQDRLFQVFSQIDASHTRKYGGTGLGLAISKQLVELMGGSIGVESQTGQGSTFWFAVPLQPRTFQQANGISQATSSVPLGKEPERPTLDLEALPQTGTVRLLLVEDNPINQKLAVRLLNKFGYEVDVADNGCEALAALSKHAYGAILMDCQMPEMDGFETTREIRRREAALTNSQDGIPPKEGMGKSPVPAASQQPATVRTPIIALTANAVQGDKERCLEAGMDDYLTKPINPTALKATLRRWLSSAAK